MSVVTESLGDVEGLHCKLDRHRSVEQGNQATKEQFHQVLVCSVNYVASNTRLPPAGAVHTHSISLLSLVTHVHLCVCMCVCVL